MRKYKITRHAIKPTRSEMYNDFFSGKIKYFALYKMVGASCQNYFTFQSYYNLASKFKSTHKLCPFKTRMTTFIYELNKAKNSDDLTIKE